MIELTEQQVAALDCVEAGPPRFVNPRTKEIFVLLRIDEYERLKQAEYDDSPSTREELEVLAWETDKQAGWDDMDDMDELLASNSKFQALVAKSKAGPRKPFVPGGPERTDG